MARRCPTIGCSATMRVLPSSVAPTAPPPPRPRWTREWLIAVAASPIPAFYVAWELATPRDQWSGASSLPIPVAFFFTYVMTALAFVALVRILDGSWRALVDGVERP